jgi:fatty acid desaturase
MWKQLNEAAGYLAILVVPGLLIVGIWLDVPSLAFGVVMLVSPLLRPVFGNVAGQVGVWRESVATALDRLPLLYAIVLLGAMTAALVDLTVHGVQSAPNAIGLGLSLWMTLVLSTCVSHELIHRRNATQAMIGHGLAGLAGYPVLAQEHLAHHARPGDTASAAWPRIDESAWRFALRRSRRVFADAYGRDSAIWSIHSCGRSVLALRVATAVSAATAASFASVAGWSGLLLYLCVAVGVCFGVQIITYIQHWGLGDDHLGQRASHGYGWEDDCRLQARLTLSVSLHHGHHQSSARPFYSLSLTRKSPRLPAGYIVLMALCLFPRAWFHLMRPVLKHWEAHPEDPRSPGRRLTCFSLYQPKAAATVTH